MGRDRLLGEHHRIRGSREDRAGLAHPRAQRHVPQRVPDARRGRPHRVVPRRGATDPRHRRRPRLVAGRDDRHHRAARGRTGAPAGARAPPGVDRAHPRDRLPRVRRRGSRQVLPQSAGGADLGVHGRRMDLDGRLLGRPAPPRRSRTRPRPGHRVGSHPSALLGRVPLPARRRCLRVGPGRSVLPAAGPGRARSLAGSAVRRDGTQGGRGAAAGERARPERDRRAPARDRVSRAARRPAVRHPLRESAGSGDARLHAGGMDDERGRLLGGAHPPRGRPERPCRQRARERDQGTVRRRVPDPARRRLLPLGPRRGDVRCPTWRVGGGRAS